MSHELGLPDDFDNLDPLEQLELWAIKLGSRRFKAMVDEIRIELLLARQTHDAADAQERKPLPF